MPRWAQSSCASELGVIEFQPICVEIRLAVGCQKYSAVRYLCSQCFLGTEGHLYPLIIGITTAHSLPTSLRYWYLGIKSLSSDFAVLFSLLQESNVSWALSEACCPQRVWPKRAHPQHGCRGRGISHIHGMKNYVQLYSHWGWCSSGNPSNLTLARQWGHGF